MTGRAQLSRAYVTGQTPSGEPEGSAFTNFADLNLLLTGPGGSVLDLLPIRRFSETANYTAGSLVERQGAVYTNAAPVTAGAWDAGEWTSVFADPIGLFLNQQGWDFTLTYTAGNVTEVLASLSALRVRQTLSYDADGNAETIDYETSTDSGGNWTTLGTLTITYDADGNALSGAWT